jgi:uncharacterized protein (TIGR01777 family)
MMRVIITGGTGLIGRALADHLAEGGYEVIVLSRRPARVTDLPAGVRAVGWDARTAAGWGPLADGAVAIVNLAGENLAGRGFLPSRWTDERKRLIHDSRLQAGQAVVHAVEAAAKKPGVVIQSSGIGYYGDPGDKQLTEDDPVGDGFLPRLAVEWEGSTAAVEAMDVRRAVVRSAMVLSVAGGSLPRLLLPFRFFVGGPMGSGRQWVSWIHLLDEVRAIRFLIENKAARGPFNLTAPNPLTNAQFSRVLGRVLRRPALLRLPAFVLRTLFGEVSSVLLSGQRALPRRLQELGFTFMFPEAEGALRKLFEPKERI